MVLAASALALSTLQLHHSTWVRLRSVCCLSQGGKEAVASPIATPQVGPRCPFRASLRWPAWLHPAGPRWQLTKLTLCSLTYGSIYSTPPRDQPKGAALAAASRCESVADGTKPLSLSLHSGQGTALLLPRNGQGRTQRQPPLKAPKQPPPESGGCTEWSRGAALLNDANSPAAPQLFRKAAAVNSHEKAMSCQIPF